MIERLPPQNLEMEQTTLACLLLDQDAIYKIADILDPEDFYNDQNKIIYGSIKKIFNSGKVVDLSSLETELKNNNLIQKAGGLGYLAKITNSIATARRVNDYALVVKDKSLRRKSILAHFQNENILYDEGLDIETVLSKTQENILKVNNINDKDDSIKSILEELKKTQIEYATKYEQGQKILGISTGIERLDEIIDGLRPGHVIVAGGWTSVGKTQFALNIVHSVLEQSISVSVISLEMSRVDTVARLIGIRHNISSMKVLKGFLDEETKNSLDESIMFFSQAQLYVHNSYFELEKIKMIIRKDHNHNKVKFFVIDYVQNIISSKGAREYDLLTSSAVELQSLARELGVTIYVVSQISNEAEKGQGAGAGFKGTGALEAVADLAIRLKRDRTKENPTDEYVPVNIIITKNRHGFTGNIEDYNMCLKSGKFVKKNIDNYYQPPNYVDGINN